MRTTFLALFLVLSMLACEGADDPTGKTGDEAKSSLSRNLTPSETGLADLTAGNRDFGLALYQQVISQKPDENVFISPHSVSLALAMAYAGAKGDTASQMHDALHFTGADAVVHESMNALDLALSARGQETVDKDTGNPFQLSVVNAAWGQTGYPFEATYLDVLALNYGAGMRLLDFETAPDPSRIIINDWVADQSKDRIKDLLPGGSISALTRLVLTNVIYFKANWLKKFATTATVDAPFTRLDGSSVTVKMMNTMDDLPYGTAKDCQFVEIPYVGGNVAMFLIVPDEGRFTAVETALDGPAFAELRADAGMANGTLGLPRFTFGFESSLNDALMALGMTDAFDDQKADFSGMDGILHNLFISLVYHKSFVAVDEDGTEAAAATAVVVDTTSIPENSFQLTLDRPFLFAIVDRPTGALLFFGRVLDPTAE